MIEAAAEVLREFGPEAETSCHELPSLIFSARPAKLPYTEISENRFDLDRVSLNLEAQILHVSN
jgi:hypothetical protein